MLKPLFTILVDIPALAAAAKSADAVVAYLRETRQAEVDALTGRAKTLTDSVEAFDATETKP